MPYKTDASGLEVHEIAGPGGRAFHGSDPGSRYRTARGIARRARDVISDEARWHSDSLNFAYDADGSPVPESDSTAVRWCAVGALRLARFESLTSSGGPPDESLRMAVHFGWETLMGWLEMRVSDGFESEYGEDGGEITTPGIAEEKLIQFNDSSTHSDVLGLLDATLDDLAEEERVAIEESQARRRERETETAGRSAV